MKRSLVFLPIMIVSILGGTILATACNSNDNKINAVKTTANQVGNDIKHGAQTVISNDTSTPSEERTPTPY